MRLSYPYQGEACSVWAENAACIGAGGGQVFGMISGLSGSLPRVGGMVPDPLHGFAFARDWIEGSGAARDFLPFTEGEAAWREAAALRDARPTAPLDPEAAAEIERFNLRCGNAAGARLAAALADPRTLAVVTGQQPNLLASPLYILLKALSAVMTARRASQALGGERPVVPVFWVASDDHDFHELRDCRLASPDGRTCNLGELITRGGAPEASPAFEWTVDAATAERLIQAAEEILPAGAEGRAARDLVRLALAPPGSDFETVFCRTLAALLGDKLPMVFIVPRMTWLRGRQREVLRTDFERPREAAGILLESGIRLAAAGYPPLISRDKDVLNGFYFQDRVRLRLVRRGGDMVAENPATRKEAARFSAAELTARLEEEPERFSANVVTRPMVQDRALPTLAYVAGPGELAYLAQLRPVYEAFGTPRAVVLMRASVLAIPAEAAARLEELDIETEAEAAAAGSRSLEQVLTARLMTLASDSAPLLEQARALAADAELRLAAMESAAAGTRPHLLPALQKTAHSVRRATERLERSLWRQIKDEGGQAWRKYSEAAALLQLQGPPQERTLAPHCLLAGADAPQSLAEELSRRIDFENPRPQIVRLEGKAEKAGPDGAV